MGRKGGVSCARPAHRLSVRRTWEPTLSVLSSETSTKPSSKGRVLAVLIGLVVGLGILYAVLVALSGGGVPRGTSALGVDLGGLTPAAAQAKLDHAVAERGGRTVTVHIGDDSMHVRPTDTGLAVDSAKTLAVAGDRTYNPITLVKRLTGHQVLAPVVTVDQATMAEFLDGVGSDVNVDPTEGGVRFDAGGAEEVTPQDGRILDRRGAEQNLQTAFLRSDEDIDLPLKTVSPTVNAAEVQRAMATFATPAVSGPVTLVVGPKTLVVQPV